MLTFSPANSKIRKLYKVRELRAILRERRVYSFDISAGVTCPGAKDCKAYVVQNADGSLSLREDAKTLFRCYAASGEVLFKPTFKMRRRNFQHIVASQNVAGIVSLFQHCMPDNLGILRLHSSGDFFSYNYFRAMVIIAELYPLVRFYAYTKSLHFVERFVKEYGAVDLACGKLRQNFLLTASRGGKYDDKIASLGIRECIVVPVDYVGEYPVDENDSHAATAGGSFAIKIHGVGNAEYAERFYGGLVMA